ncbi:hypothetical protein PH5382_03805 [Phaeobacter sp. CECT 5382]|nr:hypothetical protein PH5382_03805 [Phaeobacter sp. CECT 5382]
MAVSDTQAIPKGGQPINQTILLCYADVGARNISGFPTAAQNQIEVNCRAQRSLRLLAGIITPHRKIL